MTITLQELTTDAGGIWALAEGHQGILASTVSSLGMGLSLQGDDSEPPKTLSRGGREFAVIDVKGGLSKRGFFGTSTVKIVNQLQKATAGHFDAIILDVDSPGGSVSGQGDVTRAVTAAGKVKPVLAYASDMAASAAYDIFAHANVTAAAPEAELGSIGVYAIIPDFSKLVSDMGVNLHLIKFGKHKGGGSFGLPIDDEFLAEMQGRINSFGDMFVRRLQSALPNMTMARMHELADGRTYFAPEAQQHGLVQVVASFDEALSNFVTHSLGGHPMAVPTNTAPAATNPQTVQPQQQPAPAPAQQQPAPAPAPAPAPVQPVQAAPAPVQPMTIPHQERPATAAELQQALPQADQAFLFGQLSSNATVAQAAVAWANQCQQQMAQQQQQQAQAPAAPANPAQMGNEPVAGDPNPGDQPADPNEGANSAPAPTFAEWQAQKQAYIKAGMDPIDALCKVDREMPGVRQAAINADGSSPVPVDYNYETAQVTPSYAAGYRKAIPTG